MSIADASASQYLTIHREVIKSETAPKGLILHTAGDVDGNWEIFDVWESPAAFEAFSQQLVPVLKAQGITTQPLITVTELYNVWAPTSGLSTLERIGSDPLPATVTA
jgi:hypothetical protein